MSIPLSQEDPSEGAMSIDKIRRKMFMCASKCRCTDVLPTKLTKLKTHVMSEMKTHIVSEKVNGILRFTNLLMRDRGRR